MEDAAEVNNPTTEEVVEETAETVPDETHDVDKTLYDAEEFLTNFAGLRDENEQLKHSNQELQLQLEKATQDLQQLELDKQTLESQLIQEREQHKEALWKLRSDVQKIQEERLQWKEKYLDACMKSSNQPTGLNEVPSSNNLSGKNMAGKRKRSALNTSTNSLQENDAEDFYSNLSTTFGLNEDENQPVTVVIIKKTSENEEHNSFEVSRKTFNSGKDVFGHTPVRNSISPAVTENTNQHIVRTRHNSSLDVKPTFLTDEELSSSRRRRNTTSPKIVIQSSEAFDALSALENNSANDTEASETERETERETEQETKQGMERGTTSGGSTLEHYIQLVHYHERGVKSYVCTFCNKEFSAHAIVKRHIAIHLDERPFVCEHCGQGFKVKQYLMAHLRGKHSSKSYTCKLCHKVFSWRATYYTHSKKCKAKVI